MREYDVLDGQWDEAVNAIKDYAKLSIVVQGPLHEALAHRQALVTSTSMIAELRERFPTAQIVISTWNVDNVPELPGCEVVISEDPGAFKYRHPDCGKLSNFNYNRMLLSTKAGLARVTRDYVLKIRSDTHVHADTFWGIFNQFSALKPARKLFTKPIVVSSIYSRDPLKSRRLFHPSDMIQFGRVKDLRKLWSAEPIDAKAWVELKRGIEAGQDLLSPEQILTLDLLRREGWFSTTPTQLSLFERIRLSEELIGTCFVVAEPEQLGISNADRFSQYSDPHTCYSHETWKSLRAGPSGYLHRQMRALLFVFQTHLRSSQLAMRVGRALTESRR